LIFCIESKLGFLGAHDADCFWVHNNDRLGRPTS